MYTSSKSIESIKNFIGIVLVFIPYMLAQSGLFKRKQLNNFTIERNNRSF